jgi:hypothetical protein
MPVEIEAIVWQLLSSGGPVYADIKSMNPNRVFSRDQ